MPAKGYALLAFFMVAFSGCLAGGGHDSIDAYRMSSGTSFAAPTVAGALSKVVLEIRRHTGYVGTVVDGIVDPTTRVSNADMRSAMNLTASYAPQAQYNNTSTNCGQGAAGLALNPFAPWQQWGWGFYDATIANATIAYLLGQEKGTHPADAVAWMETKQEVTKRLWGT